MTNVRIAAIVGLLLVGAVACGGDDASPVSATAGLAATSTSAVAATSPAATTTGASTTVAAPTTAAPTTAGPVSTTSGAPPGYTSAITDQVLGHWRVATSTGMRRDVRSWYTA